MLLNNSKFGSATEPFRENLFVQFVQFNFSNPPFDLDDVVDINDVDVITITADQVVAKTD